MIAAMRSNREPSGVRKRIPAIAPALFLLFITGGAIASTDTLAAPAPTSKEAAPAADRVVVYYFHRTLRCYTCLGLEKAAREAVHEGYLDRVEARTLEWQAVDFELTENAHFEKEFDLEGSTLLFAETAGGKTVRWEKIDGMWDFVARPEDLRPYVGVELRRFLAEAKAKVLPAVEERAKAAQDPEDAAQPRTGERS
jgi:hypothetical protein